MTDAVGVTTEYRYDIVGNQMENITTVERNFNGFVVSGYDKAGAQTEHYYYGSTLLAAEYVQKQT